MMRKHTLRLCAVMLAGVMLLAGCADEKSDHTQASEQPETTTAQSIPSSITLGGTASELTFTDTEGTQISLTELLKEKELVVLNFWFADCGWCRKEFPVMEVSYQRYREDVEILAVNPFDSEDAIAAFQKENSLSFPMLSCSKELALAFGVNGYPTSVCIDREGTISLIHPGAITDAAVFDRLFETYTGEDYRSRVFNSLYEILE